MTEKNDGMAGFYAPYQPIIYTPETFALEIERRIKSGEDDSYISATSDLIESMDCEPEEVLHLLSVTLVGKIEAEAYERGLMKEKNRTINIAKLFG